MKNRLLLLAFFSLPTVLYSQLTVQHGANLFLGQDSEVFIQGDITSSDDIDGEGAIIFIGKGLQNITFNNNRVPGLRIENSAGVLLNSDVIVEKKLILSKGHLQAGQYRLTLGNDANVAGNQSAHIQTGTNGRVIKLLNRNLSHYFLPVGAGSYYTPLQLESNGAYVNASIDVGARSTPSPNRPPGSKDYLDNHWTITRKGITGELYATAFFEKVNGHEEVSPYYWNGFDWVSKGSLIDTKKKSLTLEIPEGLGEVYAMNRSDNFLARNTVLLLPNPVQNVATLLIRSKNDKDAVVTITDGKGSAVVTQRAFLRRGTNQLKMNVTPLSKGYYTISLSSDGWQQSLRMIKN